MSFCALYVNERRRQAEETVAIRKPVHAESMDLRGGLRVYTLCHGSPVAHYQGAAQIMASGDRYRPAGWHRWYSDFDGDGGGGQHCDTVDVP